MKKVYKNSVFTFCLITVLATSSCKKFVELGPPPTQISFEDAFKTDAAAQSTVLGIYSLASAANLGFINSNTFYPEISGRDLQYNGADPAIQEFSNRALTNTNTFVNSTWGYLYALVKNANNSISGITASNTLTATAKSQLLGEAKFLRAFFYFQLVNLYGDVPLPLLDANSAIENSILPRTASAQVYAQIITDLTEAQAALPTAYVGTFRGRVNKLAATALLARVYLYQKDFANAEAQATQVITSGSYSLPAPSLAFINTSNEVIWQIANITGFSVAGASYVTSATVIPNYSLTEATYQTFESTADLRRSNWVGPKSLGGRTYYAITKYKVASGIGNEYNIVLRFAEQYLIRAEARAQLNNLTGAKADIDVLRIRAGLTGLSAALTQPQMLTAIERERRLELFGEWGHRWFDLKRNTTLDASLYPIPQAQILLNTSLTQNPGY